MRAATLLIAGILAVPALAAAQNCTPDERQVVDAIYRQVLERGVSAGEANEWITQLRGGQTTVRELVENIAVSPEHRQRFLPGTSEGSAMMDTEPVLDGNRGRRKGVVRRRGRQHDQVDRLGVEACVFQRRARSVDRQVRSEFAFGRDVAFPDAGPLYDPFVRRIDPGGEFRIGQDLLRQIGTAAQHDRTFRTHETTSCAICACVSALILVRRSQRTIS